MAPAQTLGDPDFEPSDEQLTELSKRAFADVARNRAAALQRLRREISVERSKVRAQLQQQLASAAQQKSK